MTDFQIGKPTNDIPPVENGIKARFGDLIADVKALKNGEALPLEFPDVASATLFCNGRSSTFRKRGVRMQRRRRIIYLSKVDA